MSRQRHRHVRMKAEVLPSRAYEGARHGSRAVHARHCFQCRGTAARARVGHRVTTPSPSGAWRRCTCTVYVYEDMLGMLKLMLGAIILHHIRVVPLLGAAHRPRVPGSTKNVQSEQSLLSQCSPFSGSLPGSGDFRVIFRLVWEAEKVGWEVNYEFFRPSLHPFSAIFSPFLANMSFPKR